MVLSRESNTKCLLQVASNILFFLCLECIHYFKLLMWYLDKMYLHQSVLHLAYMLQQITVNRLRSLTRLSFQYHLGRWGGRVNQKPAACPVLNVTQNMIVSASSVVFRMYTQLYRCNKSIWLSQKVIYIKYLPLLFEKENMHIIKSVPSRMSSHSWISYIHSFCHHSIQ